MDLILIPQKLYPRHHYTQTTPHTTIKSNFRCIHAQPYLTLWTLPYAPKIFTPGVIILKPLPTRQLNQISAVYMSQPYLTLWTSPYGPKIDPWHHYTLTTPRTTPNTILTLRQISNFIKPQKVDQTLKIIANLIYKSHNCTYTK